MVLTRPIIMTQGRFNIKYIINILLQFDIVNKLKVVDGYIIYSILILKYKLFVTKCSYRSLMDMLQIMYECKDLITL